MISYAQNFEDVLLIRCFGKLSDVYGQLQSAAAAYKPFVQMLPYVLTLALVCGFIGRSTPPAALGVPGGGR